MMSMRIDSGPSLLNSEVKAFFMDWITVHEDTFQFSYQDSTGIIGTEYWGPGLRLAPSSAGVWLAHDGLPAQVRHLFLSHSAADILCFCQLKPEWMKETGDVAFAGLGLLANDTQVKCLIERYANAKMHTIFDSGLIGRVSDCKVALWKCGRDATFKVVDDYVLIQYRHKRCSIPGAMFSLNHFEKTIGIRSGIRSHKPRGVFESSRNI